MSGFGCRSIIGHLHSLAYYLDMRVIPRNKGTYYYLTNPIGIRIRSLKSSISLFAKIQLNKYKGNTIHLLDSIYLQND